MNIDAVTAAQNPQLLGGIRGSLESQRASGGLSDSSIQRTLNFWLERVFGPAVKATANLNWRLMVGARLEYTFREYYTPAAQAGINPTKYDKLAVAPDSGLLANASAFLEALGAEADSLISPNLRVIQFLGRNAVIIGIVGVVGFVFISNRAAIKAVLKL